MVEDQAVVEDQVEADRAAAVAACFLVTQAQAEEPALTLGRLSPLQDRRQCHSKAAEWAWVVVLWERWLLVWLSEPAQKLPTKV